MSLVIAVMMQPIPQTAATAEMLSLSGLVRLGSRPGVIEKVALCHVRTVFGSGIAQSDIPD